VKKIEVLPSDSYASTVTERIADVLKSRAKDQPFHLFLSGGSTPKVVYAALADCGIDWKGLHLWWGDERFVPPDHPDSNFRMVKEQLLDKIQIPTLQVHPWPILSSPELSAATYDREYREYFQDLGHKLNFQLLGMGDDGHTASLFPGTSALDATDNMCVANHVEGKESVRLSLTYPALARSERVVFLVKGANKAEAAQQVLEEGMHPASQVVGKGSTEFWLDTAAAALLKD
jgi:6-phosphogluconolactonase